MSTRIAFFDTKPYDREFFDAANREGRYDIKYLGSRLNAVALILSLNRKIHKAYYRTRDSNFSIHGLLGFDLHGKTAGVIGTGKIGRFLAGEALPYEICYRCGEESCRKETQGRCF